MPKTLAPIPLNAQIVDKLGTITDFFRLRWQDLITGFQTTPTKAALDKTGLTAALVTTTLLIATTAAQHRVNTTLTRTVNDGVSSSAAITIGFTQGGTPQTIVLTAITEAGTGVQGISTPVFPDVNTAITIALSYSSNTPNKATFALHATGEQMA